MQDMCDDVMMNAAALIATPSDEADFNTLLRDMLDDWVYWKMRKQL